MEPAPMVTIGRGFEGYGQAWRSAAGSKVMALARSIVVEDLFGHRPPFPLLTRGERRLHRLMDRPPFLGLRVGLHFRSVDRPIVAVVLPVAEQQVLRFSQE